MIFTTARLAVAGGIFAAGLVAGLWLQENRVERAKTTAIEERVARQQRDDVIAQLRESNKNLQESIKTQNDQVIALAQAAQERQETATVALETARRSNHATVKTVAALAESIRSGTGDCAKAIREVRMGL